MDDHFDKSHKNPEEIIEPIIKNISLIMDNFNGKASFIYGYDV